MSKDQIKYITPYFTDACVKAGFFRRYGGVSKGLYSSLNCATKSLDDPQSIAKNKKLICSTMGFNSVFEVAQIHSGQVLTKQKLDHSESHAISADAIVTKSTGILIGVKTADCCPILLYEPKAKIIAATHAGWRGTSSGIIQHTINGIVSLGGDKSKVLASLGPTIQPYSYEVGHDFMLNLIKDDYSKRRFFIEIDGKIHFNLPSFCITSLIDAGISPHQIQNIAIDTYPEQNGFFSYRRTYHQLKGDITGLYASQFSVIGITS